MVANAGPNANSADFHSVAGTAAVQVYEYSSPGSCTSNHPVLELRFPFPHNLHRVAAFGCESCGAEEMVPAACGRLQEPQKCGGCGASWTMKLLHNRCCFQNKQLIKMQVGRTAG